MNWRICQLSFCIWKHAASVDQEVFDSFIRRFNVIVDVFIAVEYATFPSTNISFDPSVGKRERFSNRETEFWISIPHNF